MNAKKKAAVVSRASNISTKWAGPMFNPWNLADIGWYIESVIEHLQKEDTSLAVTQERNEVDFDYRMERDPSDVEVGDNSNRQEILIDIAVLERLLEIVQEDS